jgi:hypothetical protein
MKMSSSHAWILALGLLSVACLAIGSSGLVAAYLENGGCEAGRLTPDSTVWQPCTALNPKLVWGGILAAIGLILTGLTSASAAISAAITSGFDRRNY